MLTIMDLDNYNPPYNGKFLCAIRPCIYPIILINIIYFSRILWRIIKCSLIHTLHLIIVKMLNLSIVFSCLNTFNIINLLVSICVRCGIFIVFLIVGSE